MFEMSNPVQVNINPGVWTLVAENVTGGLIEIVGYQPSSYRKDYRTTGDPPPTDPNPTQRPVQERLITISARAKIDVYIRFDDKIEFGQGSVVVNL